MQLKLLFFLNLIFFLFACAPLRPIGPAGGTPGTLPEKPKDEPEIVPVTPEPVEPDTAIRRTIDVGVGFERGTVTIECPERIWEFRAGSTSGRTEIATEGFCKYAGKTYRGNWAVLSTDSGIAVINSLNMEDYLKGVVPHEIGRLNQEGFEALKAQAVAARTYAYAHLGSRRSQGFDVYADTRDQVYNGKNDEDSLVNEAISATNNLVIKYNGNLIEAFYHSTCGGKTESTEVWAQENRPYLLPVADSTDGKAFCETSRYINWEERFTKAELAGLFQRNLANARADSIFSFGKVEQVFITEKFPSGRVRTLVVFTDKGSFGVFGDRVRWLFQRNGKILPSAAFDLSRERDNFTLKGSGFGHGIGMCQVGTIARAKAGQKFDEILKAYYTGVIVDMF